jgi:hypothetical protein
MVSKTPDRREHARTGQGRADRLHAGGVRAHPAAQRPLQRQVRLALHPGRARAAWHGADRARSSTPSTPPAGHPDFELAECLRNIHRIAEIRLNDKFGVTTRWGQRVWDWAEELATHSDPGFKEAGPAHRDLPHRSAPGLRPPAAVLDEGLRLRRSQPRRGGQRGGCLPRQRPGRAAAADRQPLRHRAQRRQVRRPAGHPGADGRGAASCTAPAGACPTASRWWPLPKRKASATRPPSWAVGRADRRLRPGLAGPDRRRRRAHAQRDAGRRPAGHDGRHPRAAARPGATSASSRCTSSRARCSTSWTCRWAWSPPSTAACATWAR